jgi:hypothetical protein
VQQPAHVKDLVLPGSGGQNARDIRKNTSEDPGKLPNYLRQDKLDKGL